MIDDFLHNSISFVERSLTSQQSVWEVKNALSGTRKCLGTIILSLEHHKKKIFQNVLIDYFQKVLTTPAYVDVSWNVSLSALEPLDIIFSDKTF